MRPQFCMVVGFEEQVLVSYRSAQLTALPCCRTENPTAELALVTPGSLAFGQCGTARANGSVAVWFGLRSKQTMHNTDMPAWRAVPGTLSAHAPLRFHSKWDRQMGLVLQCPTHEGSVRLAQGKPATDLLAARSSATSGATRGANSSSNSSRRRTNTGPSVFHQFYCIYKAMRE